MTEDQDTLLSSSQKITTSLSTPQQSLLYRQYQKLDSEGDRKRLARLVSYYRQFTFYGEFNQEYSNTAYWGRRYFDYVFEDRSGHDYRLTAGSYNDHFGLGLIYGYHGKLLGSCTTEDGLEQFLYPYYGGSNGVRFVAKRSSGAVKVVYDVDRTDEFGKEFGGVSFPLKRGQSRFQLSAGYGRLRNRGEETSEEVPFFSTYGETKLGSAMARWELAFATHADKLPKAVALKLTWKTHTALTNIVGWKYDTDYPAWFAGGPSSNRSRTIQLDEIGFSFSDKFSGEGGVAAKTSYRLNTGLTLRTAVGYAWRDMDDNRTEARSGLEYRWNKTYRTSFDFYRRNDDICSDNRSLLREQVDVVREKKYIRTRLVLGHQRDRLNDRDDYLVFLENRLTDRLGRLWVLGKLDHLKWGDLKNRYLYIALAHETEMTKGMNLYVKYTYRYHENQPEDDYGLFRWDLNWSF